MHLKAVSFVLSALVLVLGSNPSLAADKTKPVAPPSAASQAQASPSATKIKLIDINSATRSELKQLPGITEADAAKIIAGRPYGSKAQLVSHNIISAAVYQNLKTLIVATQYPSFNGAASSASPSTNRK
jgi:competence protein ComEA